MPTREVGVRLMPPDAESLGGRQRPRGRADWEEEHKPTPDEIHQAEGHQNIGGGSPICAEMRYREQEDKPKKPQFSDNSKLNSREMIHQDIGDGREGRDEPLDQRERTELPSHSNHRDNDSNDPFSPRRVRVIVHLISMRLPVKGGKCGGALLTRSYER